MEEKKQDDGAGGENKAEERGEDTALKKVDNEMEKDVGES